MRMAEMVASSDSEAHPKLTVNPRFGLAFPDQVDFNQELRAYTIEH